LDHTHRTIGEYRKQAVSLTLVIMLSVIVILAAGCSDDTQQAPNQPEEHATITLTFNGGPRGGTFNYFANKMSSLMGARVPWLDMLPRESGGSLENICDMNMDLADMGIVYSGDAFLGRNGKLDCPESRLDHTRAVAYLYGAPAQLVVRKDSDIASPMDLVGKRVAVGNKGSGAALSAERFFKHLGIWDKMDHRNQGYSQAAADFMTGKVDAFWVLVGYPNSSIIEAASKAEIKLVDLHEEAMRSDFYEVYPFYDKTEIPADTYQGQTEPVTTFQDAALWCVRGNVDEDAVYQSLKTIFSEAGLEGMRKAHKAARSMSIENGINTISIPLHPGAIRFWTEQGVEIPPILLP